MGMGRLPHADSGVSHSLPVPPSHTLLQPPPRRLLVHRAHVVLFSYYVAATTIAPLCSNIALSCDPHSARAYRTRAYALYHHIHSTYTTPRRGPTISLIAHTRYFAYRNPPDHYSQHNLLEATIATASFVRRLFFLPILGRSSPPSFDLNGAIVPANKAGPTTSLMP